MASSCGCACGRRPLQTPRRGCCGRTAARGSSACTRTRQPGLYQGSMRGGTTS
ncbi:hypothetical protein VHUM_01707 [Vanrija humicola]|uniref:Uncharacterized protein n=1 Tax=Vanrija humicola TaxID=5417 RepID=A0A7D8Z0I6_VANHU|nr:hypothetical protein VHUM_01707 [Vanrija humicola]